jgi:hypothetical protein
MSLTIFVLINGLKKVIYSIFERFKALFFNRKTGD